MPGNDFNGGFASHITVPGRFLCRLPEDMGKFKVSHLSVVADAVTTPYQSLQRSGLKKGDLAIVIGVGGIGTYMAQIAKDAGATVIAIDIDDAKLENAIKMGADYSINAKGLAERDVRDKVRALGKENKLPRYGMSFRTGIPCFTLDSSFLIRPPMTAVSPLFTMTRVSASLVEIMTPP